jgi:transcriptional regulator with XRE-family HTH domain
VSEASGDTESVADRIENVRQTIPPPKGRAARNPYISMEDFAEVLDVSRATIFRWYRGEGIDEQNRQKLAGLSQGRYTPDDFMQPPREALLEETRRLRAENQELRHRIAELEQAAKREEHG